MSRERRMTPEGSLGPRGAKATRSRATATPVTSPKTPARAPSRQGRQATDRGRRITRLAVKVVPGSSRDAIVGWLGEALKVKVAAPPEKGKANARVIEMLAVALGIGTDDIEVTSGHASPSKIVTISGMLDEEVRAALP